MPNDLLNTDPLIAQNFFLEVDGAPLAYLSGVSGMDIEVDVASTTQVGKNGMSQLVKTVGQSNKPPDLTLTRMAVPDATKDGLWKWFEQITGKGMGNAARTAARKNGSIVIYDSANQEISRFNFMNAWPSKISTDALSADSNDPIKETITLVCERLERVK